MENKSSSFISNLPRSNSADALKLKTINNNNNNYCHHKSCIESSLRGLRNGLYYGAKIRFLHSLIMTFLFKNDTFKNKIKNILSLTWEHSKNLGLFVFIYKSLCCLFRKLFKTNSGLVPFISGIIGSYIMWSKSTPVNQQLMFYLFSRISTASTNFFADKINSVIPQGKEFAFASCLVWGVCMLYFEKFPSILQKSLFDSMDFLYNQSNYTESWRDFVPFAIPFY